MSAISDIINSIPNTGQYTAAPWASGAVKAAAAHVTAPVVAPPIFKKPAAAPGTPASAVIPPSPAPVSPYINPATGQYYTPDEYAASVAAKLPQQGNDVGNYAGNALTDPNQSATDLEKRATTLNNSRNDIATGTTDPYKVGSQSGIAYTPAELNAVEKAYAGIYDPAIDDAIARLKDQQTKDKAAADEATKQSDANKAYARSVALKQTPSYADLHKASGDNFTPTQTNKGASTAGMSVADFGKLDPNVKNYFVNMPKMLDPTDATGVKKVPADQLISTDLASVKSGDMTIAQFKTEMDASNLPDEVKQYYIDQLPATDVVKPQSFWSDTTGQ